MFKRELRLALIAIVAVLLCQQMVVGQEQSDSVYFQQDAMETLRDRESLFRWSSDPWESPAVEYDRLTTDRPHLAEATSLVGRGHAQLETGFSYSNDLSNGVRTQSYSFPEPLLRLGVLAEWFELRLGWNYLVSNQNPTLGAANTDDGSEDMYIGAKIALFKQHGWLPDFTVFPQMNVPSGSNVYSADAVLPGVNLAYSWAVNRLIELECNTVLSRQRDAARDFYFEVFQTVNLEWDLGERWMGFTEYVLFHPNDSTVVTDQHYFHYGLHYFVTPKVQIDVHHAVGLNGAAADLAFTGIGLSVFR